MYGITVVRFAYLNITYCKKNKTSLLRQALFAFYLLIKPKNMKSLKCISRKKIGLIIILFFLVSCKKETDEGGASIGNNMSFTKQSGRIYEPDTGGFFGYDVAISSDGNTAVVGAPSADNNKGKVYIYIRNNNNWTLQASLTGPVNSYNLEAGFGTSVSISADGNTVFSGDDYNDFYGSNASFFKREGTAWSEMGTALKLIPNSIGSDLYGRSISLSADGNIAVAGGFNGGRVSKLFIFNRVSDNWKNAVSITVDSTDGTRDLILVNKVAISGDGNVIALCKAKRRGGAANIDFDGEIDMYSKVNNTWVKNSTSILPSEKSDEYEFGRSISLSQNGSFIIAGTSGENNIGGAYVFSNILTGKWIQQGAKLTNDINSPVNDIGSSVSISADGQSAIINGNLLAPDASSPFTRKNIIFFYNQKSDSWKREGDYLIDDISSGSMDDFDYGENSISLSGNATTILFSNVFDFNKSKGYINFFYP